MTRSRLRTLTAILLFLPLAAILLVTFACLPAPVGDPDQSRIDDKIIGAWQSVESKNDETLIALLRPWDKHTYYLQYMNIKKDDKDKVDLLHFKAWLTNLGDFAFITCEPIDNLDYAFGPGKEEDKWWFVGRVELKDDTLTFRPVNEKSWIVKDLTTRDKIEAAIKAQVNNDELYNAALTFKKITRENMKIVEDAQKAANIGLK